MAFQSIYASLSVKRSKIPFWLEKKKVSGDTFVSGSEFQETFVILQSTRLLDVARAAGEGMKEKELTLGSGARPLQVGSFFEIWKNCLKFDHALSVVKSHHCQTEAHQSPPPGLGPTSVCG